MQATLCQRLSLKPLCWMYQKSPNAEPRARCKQTSNLANSGGSGLVSLPHKSNQNERATRAANREARFVAPRLVRSRKHTSRTRALPDGVWEPIWCTQPHDNSPRASKAKLGSFCDRPMHQVFLECKGQQEGPDLSRGHGKQTTDNKFRILDTGLDIRCILGFHKLLQW